MKKIAEISKKCGFESPSYFGAVFRKHRGMTPDTYRKWIPIEHK
ncbi:MAG: helix-turn-helix domain-containing protein [Eubacterium ramulus]